MRYFIVFSLFLFSGCSLIETQEQSTPKSTKYILKSFKYEITNSTSDGVDYEFLEQKGNLVYFECGLIEENKKITKKQSVLDLDLAITQKLAQDKPIEEEDLSAGFQLFGIFSSPVIKVTLKDINGKESTYKVAAHSINDTKTGRFLNRIIKSYRSNIKDPCKKGLI